MGERKKNIIVAGAAGFIGTSLIKRLIKDDVHIWAIDYSFDYKWIPKSDKVTEITNIQDISSLGRTLGGNDYDAFYNFSWRGVNGPEKADYRIQLENINLMLKYAELAKILGCKKYLYAGTIAERAIDSLKKIDKTSGGMMYSAAKYCGHILLEVYCKNVGLNFVWMQFSNIYGPENKTGNLISYTISQLKDGNPACFGPALQPYDFLYVDDLIEAISRLGMKNVEGNYYYLGSGSPRILKEYLMCVGSTFGRPDLIHIDERSDDGICYSFDMFDSTRAIREIGYYVSDSFENHIKYTIENY